MNQNQIFRHSYSADIYKNLLKDYSPEDALSQMLTAEWQAPDDSGRLWKPPHQWTHDEINELVLNEIGRDDIFARGYNILLKLWFPPESDENGLVQSDHAIRNSAVETTVGKILRMGRSAFGNPSRFPDGPLGTYGEWVMFRTGQRQIFEVNGIRLAHIADDRILGPVDDPEHVITGIQMEFDWAGQ